ncbi:MULTISPECIES: hypothetical protein [unclassified Bradyrhizobium]|uniref:hypothetical protein n=1 Tax=unclassified Bradyrhizobium TaxID=2631580 RepID=UPI002916A078|nr:MULTISPECIES: hypothetical protein [unclassified Bradyrhizobium]
MACIVDRDANGNLYTVPAAPRGKTPGGRVLPGVPELAIWWARHFKDRADETLIIKQENTEDRADVVELTLGQLYDAIDALNKAVEDI